MRNFLLIILLTACSTLCTAAADFDPLAASIDENLRHPAVPAKAAQAVSSAMNQLVRTLRNAGYTVQGVRNGEVVMVTIPASELFAPGASTLKSTSQSKLRGLLPYVQRTDNYKVIVAAHSDNTGDELYNDRLTADRANAVDEYFFNLNNSTETGIIPYGLGYDEPVAPNNSIQSRARNRRIEVYFVPTSEYIDKIKKRR